MKARAARLLLLSLFLVVAGTLCQGQQPQLSQPTEFDVASVKPNLSDSRSSSTNTAHGRLTYTNVSLRRLIQSAFGVNDFQIVGGPGWLGTDKFDIEAKADVSAVTGHVDYGPMLQALLKDRFQLKFHRETRELPVYSLVTAKGAPKLNLHTGDEGASTSTSHGSGKADLVATRVSMAGLAERLGRELGSVVLDNTGLKAAEYDVKLEWSPDPTPDSTAPSLFTALQEQLGLKLEATKGPVEVVVVESAEKPSAN
jgi:uncharacterized protein (TIGR03435 family)